LKRYSIVGLVILLLGIVACGLPSFDGGNPSTAGNQNEQTGSGTSGQNFPNNSRDFNRARIVNDEGGPVVIRGEVNYTNPFFTSGVASPLVILEDQAGFIDRDREFIFPAASQTLGQITSDFYRSPFTYSVSLPAVPQGSLRDVDNDGESDVGVMVFAVAYWNNIWGDPYLEERDLGGGGWSTAYASTRTLNNPDPELDREIAGGKFLIYAPEEGQAFPSGFGPDGLLFTGDEPVVEVPTGWTIVDMDIDPFTFDRSREATLELYEPEDSALVDFSLLSYTDAFDAMLEKMRTEYAFTEAKNIDWDALGAKYRPRFEVAEANNDEAAYALALRDFLWEIPDGHIATQFLPSLFSEYQEAISGGVGLAVMELSDGSIMVSYVLEGSPADQAGIELGAEITGWDGVDVQQALENQFLWLGPFSTTHSERLNQLRQLTRVVPGSQVSVTYTNPGTNSAQNVTLTGIAEQDSWVAGSTDAEFTGFELPVDYEYLPSGYVYVRITSFLDNDLLSIQLWERLMRNLNENSVPGIVIDMRQNGGGSGFLADQMAAYFFNEELELGNTGRYDEDLGEFYFDEERVDTFILPEPELRYNGDVVVIVGPNCASACEFFAYDMSIQDRATIVGHYPTAGLGGSVEDFLMPPGLRVRFTVGRAVDMNGNLHIEGTGVVPDVVVPVTEGSVLGEDDVLLEEAIRILDGR